MDSEKEIAKSLIFNGLPEKVLFGKQDFVAYLENMKFIIDYNTLGDDDRRKNKQFVS